VFSTRGTAVAVLAAAGLLGSCSSGPSESSRTTTGSSTTTTVAVSYSAHVVGEVEVDSAYRQGVARADAGWIFSVNDGLFRTDDALHQTAHLVPAIPAEWKARGFNHIGDIDVENGVLYAPLEQPDYERGQQATLTYDASTFAYRSGVDVAQHENSFVTVDPATGIAYSMDRFGGDALLRYDVGDRWRPLAPLRMSTYVACRGPTFVTAPSGSPPMTQPTASTGSTSPAGRSRHSGRSAMSTVKARASTPARRRMAISMS